MVFSYLKIGVCTAAINNQKRFLGKNILVLSGERAEESTNRANYREMEPDPADRRDGTTKARRYVDRARPIHKWTEKQVWDIIEKYGVNPHPAYKMGWGRLSCMCCIFGSNNQWASVKAVAPEKFEKISAYEKEFGFTIQREKSVEEMAAKGTSYTFSQDLAGKSQKHDYTDPAIVSEWSLPLGAFGESVGPT